MQVFKYANAMPAPTWYYLKANNTQIELPEGLAPMAAIASGACVQTEPEGAFERAMTRAQVVWEQTHPAPTAEERAHQQAFLAAEADATYGGTAMSTYQARADAIEESRSLAAAFEQGTGEDVAAFVREAVGDHFLVQAAPDEAVDAQVVVTGAPGCFAAAAIDVVAEAGGAVALSIVVDGEADTYAAAEAAGVAATTVRVFAGAGALVNVTRTQTLDEGFTDIDDMGLFADADARVHVHQTVLGASRAFAGLAGDLRGDRSHIEVDTSYLGRGAQERDFNFSLRHHGLDTRSRMQADGVLAGESEKTLRGTIDLVRGCRGSEGSEHENVLIVDEGVRNKTVPVILCNEDDVAGNHGATIGHVRDEQLFYLASCGPSAEIAERMFLKAVVEKAAIEAPDAAARAGVLRVGERLAPGFTEQLGLDESEG